MKDNDRKYDNSEMTDSREQKDITDISDQIESADDSELPDDLGFDLKSSLDAAFDMNNICVSEDLIASTLAKINALKADENGQEALRSEPEENTRNDGIVSLSEKRAKSRGFLKIAGPIAAALIIGLFGFTVIRNNLLSSKSADSASINYTSNSNSAMPKETTKRAEDKYTANATAGDSTEESQYLMSENMAVGMSNDTASMIAADADALEDANAPEAAADAGGTADTADGSYWDESEETSGKTPDYGEITQSTGNGIKNTENGTQSTGDDALNTGTGADKETGESAIDGLLKEQRGEAKDLNNNDDIVKNDSEDTDEDVPQVSSPVYCYVIPEEMAGGISEIIGRYSSVSVCAGDYLAGTFRDGNSAESTGTDDSGISDGEITVNIAKYLVIKDGVIYFTDDESLTPEEDSMVYLIEDPDSMSESLISEIEELMK